MNIKGTTYEYDKLMEKFDGIFRETIDSIDEVDLSDKSKEHLKNMVEKDLNIIQKIIFELMEIENEN